MKKLTKEQIDEIVEKVTDSDFPDLIRMCDTITLRTALESLGEEEVKETKSCNHEIDFGQTTCKHCGEIYIHQPY